MVLARIFGDIAAVKPTLTNMFRTRTHPDYGCKQIHKVRFLTSWTMWIFFVGSKQNHKQKIGAIIV